MPYVPENREYVAERGARGLGAVGRGEEPTRDVERHAEHGLHVGLVEAREAASGVGGLELRGRNGVGRAVGVEEGAAVEAAEAVVEDTGEGQVQPPHAGSNLPRWGEPHLLEVIVEVHDAAGGSSGIRPGRGVDRQFGGVEDQGIDRIDDVDLDGDGSAEDVVREVGAQVQVVAAGEDVARQPVGAHRRRSGETG